MPHLVCYIGSLQRGGAERVMVNLAALFLGGGYRVTFVTTFHESDEYPLPEGAARVYSALLPQEEGGRLGNMLRRVRKLRRIFTALAPDLVLSFLGKNNVMALLATRGTGIPVVAAVRADPAMEYEPRGLRFFANLLFPRAAGVVLQTERAAAFFPARVRRRCTVLPNAVREEFLAAPLCAAGEREHRIVSVGRLDANKNQAALIRAFAALPRAEREDPAAGSPAGDYRLELYGDGEDRERLEALVRELGLEGRVVLCGAVPDVADRIRTARIYALTSYQEGMPNALLEAMALGLACVATDCPCGGPAEVIRDGENGLLLPLTPSAALETRLAEVLDRLTRDEALCERLGRAAADEVRRDYRPEAVYEQWRAYLTERMRTHEL